MSTLTKKSRANFGSSRKKEWGLFLMAEPHHNWFPWKLQTIALLSNYFRITFSLLQKKNSRNFLTYSLHVLYMLYIKFLRIFEYYNPFKII